ncbi:YD repeat-containing protein [Allocatelliglobosispora scoriae]|uniref:YD repeat-containing protein n=1 Tax=Allocatelliglobosispora scoriae TaxID=643052 RepID=A0A841C2P1_9ACTN|nr:RHS repeat domain-containing protein [Allocatelliglobosispora scoriae]MBB5874624.1 YD repeat-containing protein [Allocatelliglobosispora scoriae]
MSVEAEYALFAHASGADYGARLRAVTAPACALETPDMPECTVREKLADSNDQAGQTVTWEVEVPGDAVAGRQGVQSEGEEGTVVLLAAGASSDTGTFTKTPLSPSMSWQAGSSGGGFSTSYPLAVPPVASGMAPLVAFEYSSSSVDGRTNAESAQTSWMGEGWSYEPGYIERSYRSCAQDKATTPYHTNNTGDECWVEANATIAWGGRATELVLDDGSNTWRLADDDGSKVTKYTGPGNWGNGAETWKVTVPDGTEYHFGLNRIKSGWVTGDPETNSTFNVPVFANHSGEPCFSTTFANSWCTMTWRWNLDYVVDRSGNTMTYYYKKETPKTGWHGSATSLKNYDRAGYVEKIVYGTRKGQEYVGSPPAVVEFTNADRCLSSCWLDSTTPDEPHWPDTPWDLNCPQAWTSCTGNKSPSYWNYKRLSKVTTKVFVSGAYSTVDEWVLDHVFPATGEPTVDPALWLDDIVHTGKAVTPPITLNMVHFGGATMANRAGFEAVNTGVNVYRVRLGYITNEYGGQTKIAYENSDCGSGIATPNPADNPRRCFPQYYTDPDDDSDAGWTWWNKVRVTSVTEDDLVGGQPDVVTSYTYSMEGSSVTALWHHTDSNRFSTRLNNRSWADFRGWPTVTTVKGTGTGHSTKTKQLFFRGMHGDRTDSGWGNRTANITNSENQQYTDLYYRAGFLYEEIVVNTDTAVADSKKLHFPWQYQTGFDSLGGGIMPSALAANVVRENTTISRTRVTSTGSPVMTDTKTTTTWDPAFVRVTQITNNGKVLFNTTTNPYGDDTGTYAGDETCTKLEYAATTAAWMTNRVSATFINSGLTCTAMSQTATLAATRTYYDNETVNGALPTTAAQVRGLPSKTEELSEWTPAASYTATGLTAYDDLGRATSVTDTTNRLTTTTYTPQLGNPVTSTKITQVVNNTTGAGLDTTTTLDPLRGLPLTVTDANGKVTTGEYDALGRLTKVRHPGNASAFPDVQYTYQVQNTLPSYIKTSTLIPSGASGDAQLDSYELFDGLVRPLQTQAPGANGSRVVTYNKYDARGAVTETGPQHHSAATASGTLVPLQTNSSIGYTKLTYDGLGRKTTEQLWSANGAGPGRGVPGDLQLHR